MPSHTGGPQQEAQFAMLGVLHEILDRMSLTGPGYTTGRNLDFLCRRAAEIVEATACTLRLYDSSRQRLVLRACYGLSERYRQKPPLKPGEAIAGQVFEQGRPMAVPLINGEPRYVYRDWAIEEGARSLLCAPVLSPDGPRGTLTVYYDCRHDYTDAEVRFFTVLASVLSIAIQWADMCAHSAAQYRQAMSAFVQTLEEKHPHARGHSDRVAEYARMVGEELGLSDAHLRALEQLCPLHDLVVRAQEPDGPADRADREPGLTGEALEGQGIGPALAARHPGLESCLSLMCAPHGQLNGGEGLEELGETDLDLVSRIVTVADAYDAMTSQRPYGSAYTPARALEELYAGARLEFCPHVVASLARALARSEVEQVRRAPRRQRSPGARAGVSPA